MKNKVINKSAYTDCEYLEWSQWCNINGYVIKENKVEYYCELSPPKSAPTYAEKRAAEYPAISEQLDMLYWDKINNTNNWSEAITAVKAKYPKDESDTNSNNSVPNG